ncbi:MAG: FHA domain-containing protein, partial [Candidatus Cloacimonetes bacterium]|nr:FHA domain-containing protein [Candidatus Cloacimonadota bacterium]
LLRSDSNVALSASQEEKIKDMREHLQQFTEYSFNELNDLRQFYDKVADYKPVETTILQQRLIVVDNFSSKNFIFFPKDSISMGRRDDNDIILDCDWISGKHCRMDKNTDFIQDLDSTNGTFVNDRKKRIDSFNLNELNTFSLGRIFRFDYTRLQDDISVICLNSLEDEELKSELEEKSYIKSLFNTKFIWLREDAIVWIERFNGDISTTMQNRNYISISYNKGRYYFSDPLNNIFDYELKSSSENPSEQFLFRTD